MSAVPRPAGSVHAEHAATATTNGFVALLIGLVLLVAGALTLWQSVHPYFVPSLLLVAVLLFLAGALTLAGLYTLQPNEAAILQLFGAYRGTTRVPGLRATNPFYTRRKLSVRARNLNGERLKVNDKRGNPIEIAAVVVWHVDDTSKSAFDVDDYENFVKVQSEAAVRHLASSFAYDAAEALTHDAETEPTLLESADVGGKRGLIADCRRYSSEQG
jgi:regulator of protease activity HflC (stomatin/prohibitin superfamily)